MVVFLPLQNFGAFNVQRSWVHLNAPVPLASRLRLKFGGRCTVRASQAIGLEAEADMLDRQFGNQGVRVVGGEGGLTKINLLNWSSSEADIYLYGAALTSWKIRGKDLLYVRPDAVFTGQKPISGGIPHCFPQFGPGKIQQHGFARNLPWSIAATGIAEGNPCVTLELTDNDYSRVMWDYTFLATYKVLLESDKLLTELVVKNLDEKPFAFTTALHTYFSAAIEGVSVSGLSGLKTLNKHPDPKNPIEGTETRDAVTFPGFVDCQYLDAPHEVVLKNGLGDTISLKNDGWNDAVLWNPHFTMEASYKHFVCVENAQLTPVELQPGESWTANLVITSL